MKHPKYRKLKYTFIILIQTSPNIPEWTTFIDLISQKNVLIL